MHYLIIFTLLINILFCIPSLASATKFDVWWVRGFDFPRIQISILIIFNIILGLIVYPFDTWWQYLILVMLFISLIYQAYLIFPYTFLSKKQVIKYTGAKNENQLSILVSNVLTTNRDYDRLIELIKFRDPDIFLTLESDHGWGKALACLEDQYPYTVKQPLDNLYGMHLFSKLPLEDMEVKYLIKDHIPSIHGFVKLPNGKKAAIHCLHPRPPSPSESKTSTNRDAELLLVGKEIDRNAKLTLVFGDLNDVAWSRTTKLFQKLSGLMDPRRGRGFFNTYNAKHFFVRWPLDHVFHSSDFTLMEMARERNIGSDHFPMYVKLNYTPEAEWKQENLELDESEKKWANKKIKKGENNS